MEEASTLGNLAGKACFEATRPALPLLFSPSVPQFSIFRHNIIQILCLSKNQALLKLWLHEKIVESNRRALDAKNRASRKKAAPMTLGANSFLNIDFYIFN